MPDAQTDKPIEGETMTAQQAAACLGVTRQTITRMVKDKRLVPITPRVSFLKKQRLLFDRTTVERMAAERDGR
jgi:transcriptional regulator with XRE-family HTH domain